MAGEAHRRRVRALLRLASAAVEPDAVAEAFVHESATSEGLAPASNERLEWLGDSVLGFVVARWLFAHYPAESEGELARRKAALVSDEMLAVTARRLDFATLLIVTPGARSSGTAETTGVLASAFEAFIAALYRATSLETVSAFVEGEHLAHVERADMSLRDAKTELQELVQAQRAATPRYEEEASGPPHSRDFVSRVYVDGRCVGEGTGKSKKAAQQAAAAEALVALRAPLDVSASGTR